MALTDSQVPNPGIPMKVVDAAIDVGTDNSQYFSLPSTVGGCISGQLKLSAIITNPITCIADLEVSDDGGAHFVKELIGLDFVALGSYNLNVVFTGVRRLNLTTMGSDAVDIYASI